MRQFLLLVLPFLISCHTYPHLDHFEIDDLEEHSTVDQMRCTHHDDCIHGYYCRKNYGLCTGIGLCTRVTPNIASTECTDE